ncbi:MAG: TetR/AcrR family transcriptional regulator [Deltaproteobacteria bacterium]|nr:TetR/AcrR family transcriptional regulator [Deltaproteobacteria bacterium]
MARQANPNLQGQLLDAAVTVFAERGLLAAKVSDITDLAGVSKGAFYLHFESKEALYEQMCRQFIADLTGHLAGHGSLLCGPEALGMHVVDQLATADEALLDWLWQRRVHLQMVLAGAAGTPLAHLSDEFIEAIENSMLASIERMHCASCVEPMLTSQFLAAMATGLIVMYARKLVQSRERPAVTRDVHHFRRIMMLGALLTPDQLDTLWTSAAIHAVPAAAPSAH